MARASGVGAVTPLAGLVLALVLAGCDSLPGKPRPADRERIPSQVMAFATLYGDNCAACHGADGRHGADGKSGQNGGAIADASYLSLVSDQYLRTTVIAGRVDLGMPDWRSYTPGQPLTARQISDVVAWLMAQRRPVPGRPNSAKEG